MGVKMMLIRECYLLLMKTSDGVLSQPLKSLEGRQQNYVCKISETIMLEINTIQMRQLIMIQPSHLDLQYLQISYCCVWPFKG